jgi:hypothetical protein
MSATEASRCQTTKEIGISASQPTSRRSGILLPDSKALTSIPRRTGKASPADRPHRSIHCLRVSIKGRQRLILLDNSGKISGAYSIFGHAPANLGDQAIAGFFIKIAMR